ncbi:MAG: DNA-packaging protein [Alphaproteobacteria bacterium]|nr:DNA-packaging protein [Alphaproteobacteria bacterium]
MPSVKRLRTSLTDCAASCAIPNLLNGLTPAEIRELNRDWRYWGRQSQQLPPLGEVWRSWLILGGRGAGKTRAGAEWIRARALGLWPETGAASRRMAIIAPNLGEARAVMIEGKSGLLAVHADDERPHYEPSKRLLTWPNGALAQVFSADEPESLRGPQFDAAWCDELAKWRQADMAWDILAFGLRGLRVVLCQRRGSAAADSHADN